MSLLFKSGAKSGYQSVVDASCDAMQYCNLDLLTLMKGESFTKNTQSFETVLVILSGKATFRVGSQEWSNVGRRENVFTGKATALYVPIETEYEVVESTGQGTLRIAVCKVKAEQSFSPFLVEPDEVVVHHRGTSTWTREVHDIIADNGDGRVHRVVLGETFGAAGGWSSYPPHKHDKLSEFEVKMEEIYFFQIDPEQGFAVQLHYTEDQKVDDAHIIHNGDAFAIPNGYHPVAAAGGYKVYYLWFLGGESGRKLIPFDQPKHRWLLEK